MAALRYFSLLSKSSEVLSRVAVLFALWMGPLPTNRGGTHFLLPPDEVDLTEYKSDYQHGLFAAWALHWLSRISKKSRNGKGLGMINMYRIQPFAWVRVSLSTIHHCPVQPTNLHGHSEALSGLWSCMRMVL